MLIYLNDFYHSRAKALLLKQLCQSTFSNKSCKPQPATLLKKKLWYMCFPVNFDKNFEYFLQNTSKRLLLNTEEHWNQSEYRHEMG